MRQPGLVARGVGSWTARFITTLLYNDTILVALYSINNVWNMDLGNVVAKESAVSKSDTLHELLIQ